MILNNLICICTATIYKSKLISINFMQCVSVKNQYLKHKGIFTKLIIECLSICGLLCHFLWRCKAFIMEFFNFLVMFIPRYFAFFKVIVNWSSSMISFSVCLFPGVSEKLLICISWSYHVIEFIIFTSFIVDFFTYCQPFLSNKCYLK